ncbi:hypothetical protein ACWPM1_01240 [Tsuneonella sp. HG249]
MSVPIQHSVFGFQPAEPIIITATLWRGAMIDRYAQIEFFIDRTLACCVAAAIIPKPDAEITLPRQRCKALIKALSSKGLMSKSGPARKSLEGVHGAWDERNALCHGRIKPAAKSVAVHWTAYEKGEGVSQQMRVTPIQMLEKLENLDRLKTALGSQLGAIDKICADIAP